MTKKRGRPAKYDTDIVLSRAMVLFWQKGLSATSLDDLSEAMGMNRPSIYHAFGNKESLYRRTLETFAQRMAFRLDGILDSDEPLKKTFLKFYEQAVKEYQFGDDELGCFVTCTAPVECLVHPSIQADLRTLIVAIDKRLEQRLVRGQEEGEWSEDHDPKQGAKLLHGVLQSIAIRVRSGESKASITRFYKGAVDLLL